MKKYFHLLILIFNVNALSFANSFLSSTNEFPPIINLSPYKLDVSFESTCYKERSYKGNIEHAESWLDLKRFTLHSNTVNSMRIKFTTYSWNTYLFDLDHCINLFPLWEPKFKATATLKINHEAEVYNGKIKLNKKLYGNNQGSIYFDEHQTLVDGWHIKTCSNKELDLERISDMNFNILLLLHDRTLNSWSLISSLLGHDNSPEDIKNNMCTIIKNYFIGDTLNLETLNKLLKKTPPNNWSN